MGEISVIGVVGSGQMGNGIAHVAATTGFEVHLTDISQAALDKMAWVPSSSSVSAGMDMLST